ncbi:hypothetical protein AVEN_11956-1 [Araneus ventricosus]|uniref:Uncharacterized protein n=1 Tax=Araneus ventricosus TaxID=182803 RepID=A0A4Y2ISN5_ARAVE|nr:hypothetical protein AVEN_11956-1 [Araneus ventricosus]
MTTTKQGSNFQNFHIKPFKGISFHDSGFNTPKGHMQGVFQWNQISNPRSQSRDSTTMLLWLFLFLITPDEYHENCIPVPSSSGGSAWSNMALVPENSKQATNFICNKTERTLKRKNCRGSNKRALPNLSSPSKTSMCSMFISKSWASCEW